MYINIGTKICTNIKWLNLRFTNCRIYLKVVMILVPFVTTIRLSSL